METPRVAVVTLNWNGAMFLQECVDSILLSDYPNFCLIVVDNGSTDQSRELLEKLYKSTPRMFIISNEENLGYSKGMNVGLEAGFDEQKVQYCLVMNNDTKLDPHTISALVEVATRNRTVGFVTGKVYYYDAPNTFQTVGKKSHPVLINGGHIGGGEIDHGQYDKDRDLAFCDDVFWLVSKDVYLKTGGYDPEFFLQCEDFDWQLRAKKLGFKIMYAHKAKIWHKESMTLGKRSARKVFYDARNPLVAVRKNCEPGIVKAYLRARLRSFGPAMLKNLIKGRFCIAWAMLSGLCSGLTWKRRPGV